MTRALCALALIFLALRPALAEDAGKPPVTLYKSPECGCCEAYAGTLRDHGFAVTVIAEEDLSTSQLPVPVAPFRARLHGLTIDPKRHF